MNNYYNMQIYIIFTIKLFQNLSYLTNYLFYEKNLFINNNKNIYKIKIYLL